MFFLGDTFLATPLLSSSTENPREVDLKLNMRLTQTAEEIEN